MVIFFDMKMTKDFEPVTVSEIRNNLITLNNICFEVTDACNLACRYCVYSDLFIDHDKRCNKFMTIEMGKRVIDYFLKIWKKYPSGIIEPIVSIGFYGGEPLLNMDFIKWMVSYLENLNIEMKFSFNMTTNAMLLDKYMDFLAKKNFQLLISLDGNRKNDGHRVTPNGKESFTRVLNNVNLLKEKYPKYFKDKVGFNVSLRRRASINPERIPVSLVT